MISILALATCYNRREKTINAITSLVKLNRTLSFDFIIVDDGSTDGTKQSLKEMPQVECIDGTGELYYSGAMRIAIGEAKKKKNSYDYCLLFNDDVAFFENSIVSLIHSSNEIWIGPTCDNNGCLSYGGIRKVSTWRPKYQIIKGEENTRTICDTFNANCVLIPWDIFVCAPNIDRIYTHSMGDFDYGLTLSRAGYQLIVGEKYVGICCDNPSENSWRDTQLSIKERLYKKEDPKGLPSREWFHYLHKNYSIITAIIYSIIPFVRILLGK